MLVGASAATFRSASFNYTGNDSKVIATHFDWKLDDDDDDDDDDSYDEIVM